MNIETLPTVLAAGVIIAAAAAPCPAGEYAIPDPAAPGAGGCVSGELIYPLDEKPTPQCHASTIEATPGGLVAAWFGGKGEGAADVGIWVSRNTGSGWSKAVEVVDGGDLQEKEYPCWNPVLFLPDTGPLMLFYKVGPNPRRWWGCLVTSADGGTTWSAPRRLGTSEKLGKGNPNLIGPVKNPPIQRGGRIICPSSTEHDGWRTHFEITADGGKTWQVVGPINDGKTFGTIQATILTHPGDRLQILCRSRSKPVISQAWSDDGGRTWGPVTAAPLPNPNAGVCGVTLADGRHLLVYNHTVRGGGFPSGRNMLNVAVSGDGKAWTPVLTLERQKGEYSYPTVIQAPGGRVHVTYTYRRRSIKHVVLDPAKLEGGS